MFFQRVYIFLNLEMISQSKMRNRNLNYGTICFLYYTNGVVISVEMIVI